MPKARGMEAWGRAKARQRYAEGGGVPMPRPDPRTWVERLPRVQQAEKSIPQENMRDVLPPSVLLDSKGYDPSRKHGDAIDYNSGEMSSYLRKKDKWQKDI